jgi:hypothetical protein
MNSCCTIFNLPLDLAEAPTLTVEEECAGCDCHCGYIQFESLVPYIPQLSSNHSHDEDYITLEAKLRQQILEISRLFDVETKAEPGTYSKAHTKIVKLYGNGTRYLKIPDFVKGSLELYDANGYLISPESYAYKDGFLIFQPCQSHSTTCGCTSSCGIYNVKKIPAGWKGCLQAKAKFGAECADYAVQMAVRAYVIEFNTFGDQKEATWQGYPVSRSFKIPHAWNVVVQKYLEKKRHFNGFGVA